MNFENIIGNNKIKQELQDSIKNETISHSYLFSGQEGIGKLAIARQFAKMLLCLSKEVACDSCSSCVKFNSGNNPEYLELEPDGNYIKIAQIRQMQENVYQKPIISKKKVFIINNSDKMTEEAQNSLLKTLEEPPEYIVLILISSNDNKLLNTIKSRCLKISFNNISDQELLNYIKNKQIIENVSENIFKMCNGSIGKLEKIKENIDIYNQIEEKTDKLIDGKIKNIVQMINEFDVLYKSKEIIYDLLDYMIVIVYNYINKSRNYKEKYINMISAIEKTKIKLNSNTNYDMCIDELLLKTTECK